MVASIYIIKLLCTTVLINTVQLFVACAFTKPSFELTKSSTIYPKDLKLGNTLETSKIELKHGAVQQALDEDPASKAEQGTVDISHPNVKTSTQSLGVANVGKKEKSIRNSGFLKDYSPLHWNTLHRNPIQAPTLSHLHQSERQYPGLQTSGSYHSLINPQYGSHIPTALPLIAQPVTIQEINYAGPVVIPTIYHNFAVSYRQAHLFTDARVYDGHSIQGALLDIPTDPWIPRNEAESQFRVDSSYKENRPAVRISKPLEKEKSEVLSKNKVGESTKETDIDKEKEKSSLLAEKNIQEYIHLKDKKKDDVAGELLNEQPKNQELKTSSTTNQIKIQNQVLNQLNSHSAPVGTSKQDLKDNKKVINLAKTLRKLDLEKSQSDHIKFSKGKTPVDNVPFSKTNGKGSADRIFQKTSEDDVRISAPVLETASKSQKDFKKQQLRPSTSKEMKLVPHEKDIKDFKSFGRFSFKTQKLNANNVINSLKSKDKLTEVEKNLKQKFLTTENEINNCEADSNAEPILSYKFTLLSPVPEQNKKNDLKYIPVLIEKPRVEKEETYQQTKQKLYDNEEFLENEVQDKIDSVPIPNNYQVNSEEIGKSTGDLFEHLNKEKNIKNKYLIKENLEKSKISESSLSSYQKTNEVRSLQTETKNVDENQQAEASSIEKASQM
ncbi:expressed protein [Phakopsora pachyrhizi]|uniref:Expressed protein n=1 Tax=Phakopsora pachyrhizi TaxID=170000 RepID=A0AAV0AK87_PHAPC|nr:expressed protein [Phakopsora pachyrhizi]